MRWSLSKVVRCGSGQFVQLQAVLQVRKAFHEEHRNCRTRLYVSCRGDTSLAACYGRGFCLGYIAAIVWQCVQVYFVIIGLYQLYKPFPFST